MRICFVSQHLAAPQPGQASSQLRRMAQALARAGHEVVLLTEGSPTFSEPSVSWVQADQAHGTAALGGYPAPQMRWAMAAYQALERLHAERRLDYVEFPSAGGVGYFALRAKRWLGRFADTPLGVRLHLPDQLRRTLDGDDWLALATACIDHLEGETLRLADFVVSPSQALLEAVTLPDTVPSFVLPPPLAPLTRMGAPGATAGSPLELLFLGELAWHRQPQQLVQAAQRLLQEGLQLRLRLVGPDTPTGPFGRSLREYLGSRLTPQQREHVLLEEEATAEGVSRALQHADVLCVPSPWEGPQEELLTAMATGKVVVATQAGGTHAWLQDEQEGLLVPSGDSAALESALRRLIGDAELRRSLAKGAQRREWPDLEPSAFVARLLEAVGKLRMTTGSAPPAGDTGLPSPAVSVIVPYYNLAQYLPHTLASVRSQTFQAWEVIVVDDGSTDPDSIGLLDQLEEDPRIRVVRKPNGGLSSARNAGLAAARGRWVLPLDADDLIAPDFLQKAVRVALAEPTLAYVTSLVSRFAEDPGLATGLYLPWGLVGDLLPVVNVASTCTALMPLALVRSLGGYDEQLTSLEDWDLYARMAERGLQGAVLPEVLFHYRVRADSLVGTEVHRHRGRLSARLISKHPGLITDRTLRLQLALQQPGAEVSPLRHRLVERLNQTLKGIPLLHQGLRSVARRVLGSP